MSETDGSTVVAAKGQKELDITAREAKQRTGGWTGCGAGGAPEATGRLWSRARQTTTWDPDQD